MMEFGNLMDAQAVKAAADSSTSPQLLKQYAAIALASNLGEEGGVDALMNMPIDLLQCIIPRLQNRHLVDFLNRVPGGLPSLLIKQQQQQDHHHSPPKPSQQTSSSSSSSSSNAAAAAVNVNYYIPS